jgi:hypothetical protein
MHLQNRFVPRCQPRCRCQHVSATTTKRPHGRRGGRLLQMNAGIFPCEARLQKWGKHPWDLRIVQALPGNGPSASGRKTRSRYPAPAEQCMSAPSPSGNRGAQRLLSTGTGRHEQGTLVEQGLGICIEGDRDFAGEIRADRVPQALTLDTDSCGLDRGHR